jgi:hypothetical protein
MPTKARARNGRPAAFAIPHGGGRRQPAFILWRGSRPASAAGATPLERATLNRHQPMSRQKIAGEYFKRIVTRVTSMSRAARLRHQLGEIEQGIRQLTPPLCHQLSELIGRECANVEQADEPEAYGSQTDPTTGILTAGIDLGHERARSDNVQVRLRGMALWIALVFHETRDAVPPEMAELHRQVLRVMRQLKEIAPKASGTGREA